MTVMVGAFTAYLKTNGGSAFKNVQVTSATSSALAVSTLRPSPTPTAAPVVAEQKTESKGSKERYGISKGSLAAAVIMSVVGCCCCFAAVGYFCGGEEKHAQDPNSYRGQDQEDYGDQGGDYSGEGSPEGHQDQESQDFGYDVFELNKANFGLQGDEGDGSEYSVVPSELSAQAGQTWRNSPA